MTVIAAKKSAKTRKVGPHSRPHSLGKLDRRTKEARYLQHVRDDLTAHLGGPEHVTAPQRYLIDRVAVDLMRLELLDQKLAAGGLLADHDGRIAHALRSSVRLALRDLGFKGAASERSPIDPNIAALTPTQREVAT